MKKLGSIGGIISGVISIIFSFVVKGMSIGSWESNLSYGGDAYTGIQNASAQAANNVQDLADIVRTGLFAFLLVFGIALICFFISQMEKDKTPVAEPAPVVPAAVPVETTPVEDQENN